MVWGLNADDSSCQLSIWFGVVVSPELEGGRINASRAIAKVLEVPILLQNIFEVPRFRA